MASHAPKRPKTEDSSDGVPPAAASLKSEEHDDANGSVPITVEFKFCSAKTVLFEDGEVNGTLHVPMLQDPETG